MTVATVYDINKKKVGEVDLQDVVFGVEVNPALLHQMVVTHLSNVRQGTVKTKTRAEVKGGGKKPYRQKGTGRARHGSIRSPIFVGGGVTFGPQPRNWDIELPKKQKKTAFKMALTQKNKDGNLFILDQFVSKDGKTKAMAKSLSTWDSKSIVVCSQKTDQKTIRSVRNIPNVKIISEKNLSAFDVIKHEHLLLTKDAINTLVSRVNQ